MNIIIGVHLYIIQPRDSLINFKAISLIFRCHFNYFKARKRKHIHDIQINFTMKIFSLENFCSNKFKLLVLSLNANFIICDGENTFEEKLT